MNQVLVARARDADLIPSNVKAGVQIEDTLGNYEGVIPVSSVPGFLINETLNANVYPNTTEIAGIAVFEYNGEVYSINLHSNHTYTAIKLNLSTNIISSIIILPYAENTILSTYIDGTKIYMNYFESGEWRYNRWDYVTNALSPNHIDGQEYTSGTLLTSYTTVGGLKYTGCVFGKYGSGSGYMGFKIYS